MKIFYDLGGCRLNGLAFIFFFFFLSSMSVHAQTTLGPGDLAFTGYQSDAPDGFSFVLLTDIEANTVLSFTERGWLSTGGFIGNTEGSFTLTFGSAYSCGDEFFADGTTNAAYVVNDESGSSAGTIAQSVTFQLSSSGDQVFAFQGSLANPTLIAAIHMNGVWNSEATNGNTSTQPAALMGNNSSIAITPETDNASFDCTPNSGTPDDLAAALTTLSNWSGSNDPGTINPSCGFSCLSSCTDPVLTSLSQNP
ncbi:MAG: hypothetical protein AAFU03_17415, partial [Bacteroidota bacterium]